MKNITFPFPLPETRISPDMYPTKPEDGYPFVSFSLESCPASTVHPEQQEKVQISSSVYIVE
jgi:hypothetical protein